MAILYSNPIPALEQIHDEIDKHVPVIINQIFDKAYQYDEVMRLLANRFAKYDIALFQTTSYWAYGVSGLWTKCDSFADAFNGALDLYLAKKIETSDGITTH